MSGGGSRNDPEHISRKNNCRGANRNLDNNPDSRYNNTGFRLVRALQFNGQ